MFEYVKEQWINNNVGWYEGYIVGFPCTNNALEATNPLIKNEATLRERKPLGQFLTITTDISRKLSQQRDSRNTNYTPFAKEPTITLDIWTSKIHVIDNIFYSSKDDTAVSNENTKLLVQA